jgi:hypothetical protein
VRLELAFGPNWLHEEQGPVRVYTAPGFAIVPDAFFEVFPVVGRTLLPADAVLLHDADRALEIRRAPVERATTATGWPMTLQLVTLHASGELREIRLLATYELLVLAGYVLVRVTNARRFDEHRQQIVQLLASARPELADDTPAAISELWEM